MDQYKSIVAWLTENKIQDVEFLLPDFAGVGRGKAVPVSQFINTINSEGLRVPDSLFTMTVDGRFIENELLGELEQDLALVPDINTLVDVPWQSRKTASVICDATYLEGNPASMVPRELLKHVCKLFAEQNWVPIVAPEFEFYLIEPFVIKDPSRPKPPRGQSGRIDTAGSAFSVDILSDYSGIFTELRQCCKIQNINIDTLIHEAGTGQFELNLYHGEALGVADQAFYFKRALRAIAPSYKLNASFMAKPFPADYGSAMHIHQSLISIQDGENLFADGHGEDTPLFHSYIAGLQKYLPAVMPLMAPYPNSYLRFGSNLSAPANTHWGLDNRSVGLRVPRSNERARRVENRVPGSDANPYLAISATLLCGYLGMTEGLTPTEPLTDSAYELKSQALPVHFLDGLGELEKSDPVRSILGDLFSDLFLEIKNAEYAAGNLTLSPWELTHLLVTV